MGILLSHLEPLNPLGNECWHLTLTQKAFYQPLPLRATVFQNPSFLLINSCLRFLFSLVKTVPFLLHNLTKIMYNQGDLLL